MNTSETILALARAMLSARQIIFLTGAGMSAESGIPVFRGQDGLWNHYRPEDLANPLAFERQPELVWEWYNWRKQNILQCQPNAGHFALAHLQKLLAGRAALVTQNVDNLHHQAGSPEVIEMHGNIFQARCLACGRVSPLLATDNHSPLCPACGQKQRPHIVWFHESLDPQVVDKIHRLLHQCDLIVVIGTSGTVYPAAGFASQVKNQGGLVAEINPEPVFPADFTLAGPAGSLLPQLAEQVALLATDSEQSRN